jgi:hypothetical protein
MTSPPHSPSPQSAPARPALAEGARVQVRNHFDGGWSQGFEVIVETSDGYRLRRLSDHTVLPVPFSGPDLRPEPGRR